LREIAEVRDTEAEEWSCGAEECSSCLPPQYRLTIMGSPIRLFDLTMAGEVEVTTEALQYLQGLVQPVGLVTIVGDAQSYKGMLAAALAGRLDTLTDIPREAGAWLWPQPLPVKSIDEAGEHEFSLVVVEVMDMNEDSPAAQQILLITLLLSSHLVCVARGNLNPVFECLSLLPDLHSRAQIL